jgi:hypothetical protein
LEGAEHSILVFSDKTNLEYFTMMKVLNHHWARCIQHLDRYDIKTVYHPGDRNGKPDALSGRPEYCPEKEDRGENGHQPISLILKPANLISQRILEDIGVRTVIS